MFRYTIKATYINMMTFFFSILATENLQKHFFWMFLFHQVSEVTLDIDGGKDVMHNCWVQFVIKEVINPNGRKP